MGIILWIVFGAIVGWLASIIMKTRGGLLMDIIVGIVGAVIGGYIMTLVAGVTFVTFSLSGFLVALLGAVILLAIVKAISGRGALV